MGFCNGLFTRQVPPTVVPRASRYIGGAQKRPDANYSRAIRDSRGELLGQVCCARVDALKALDTSRLTLDSVT